MIFSYENNNIDMHKSVTINNIILKKSGKYLIPRCYNRFKIKLVHPYFV